MASEGATEPPGGRGAIVVTGASSGIGAACALHLAQRGFRVFAGVRRDADGDALRAQAAGVTPLLLDVTLAESIRAAAERIAAATGGALAALVNNAGVCIPGPLEFVPLAELRRQFEVNVFGAVAVTQALLPLLRRARGRIVNVSSISGRIALPFLGAYAASKFALEALSDAWRLELHPWGIRVSLIEPGAVDTPLWRKAAAAADELDAASPEARALYGVRSAALRRLAEEAARSAVPARAVARAVACALTSARPRTRYFVGPGTRWQACLSGILPDRLRDAMILRRLDKAP